MKKKVAIVGGGPAGMMLAAQLDNSKFDTTIYDQSKALGRKFLVAGAGGFNLTHSEPTAALIARYTPSDFLEKAISYFDNNALQTWLAQHGIETISSPQGHSTRIITS